MSSSPAGLDVCTEREQRNWCLSVTHVHALSGKPGGFGISSFPCLLKQGSLSTACGKLQCEFVSFRLFNKHTHNHLEEWTLFFYFFETEDTQHLAPSTQQKLPQGLTTSFLTSVQGWGSRTLAYSKELGTTDQYPPPSCPGSRF